MKNIQKIALACLFACAQVQAASFDCAQARSPSEKLICSNADLSELDSQLGEAYGFAKRNANADDANRLGAEQRQWLRDVRNRCVDAACLVKTYKSRLLQIDPLNPFTDKQLTCEEMRKFPKRVFAEGIDLGSGSNSPIEADYKCPESLSQQKIMQQLLALAERVRGDDGPCSGSMVHAIWRYYHFSLASAGFSPGMLARNPMAVRAAGMDWNAFARADVSAGTKPIAKFLRQWSEQSYYNHALYLEFTAEFDRVLPALAQHYETKLAMPKADAQFAARNALMLVVQRAAGSFPDSELHRTSVLVELARTSQTTPADIQRAFSGSEGKPGQYSEDEVYRALRIALVNNRTLAIVSTFAEILPAKAFLRLDAGQEPLLSLAIGSQQNLEYLLRSKVPVNAANGFGKTALFYAIASGNEKVVDTLLRAGANVNHAYKTAKELKANDDDDCTFGNLTHTRRTALMHAAQNSDVHMVTLLVEAGARLDAVDEIGYNALGYAVLGKRKDNETYLKSLGQKFVTPKKGSN
jgi:uncharacterized protein YecT (DUF1311 family)